VEVTTKNNILNLQKIKWSIVFKSGDNFGIFAQCLEKLLQSIDVKRSEIFLLPTDDKLVLDTFSSLCEKAGISYNHVDDYPSAVGQALGSYIVYITDHTLVSKNFLVKLTFCIENFDKTEKVAVVSPISNDSFPKLGITPGNLDAIQTQVSRTPKNNIPWSYTLALSPHCLMFRKSLYSTGALIAEFGFKDQILHSLYNGMYQVSANDTIIFHYPEHIDNLYEIYMDEDDPDKKRLAILYRIKIDTDYIRDVFVKSLQKTVEFADNIYVLDDNSKTKISIYLKESYPELWAKITKFEKFSRPYDERRDFNDLISWAEADGCTWALALEGDEIVEDKVTRTYLEKLLWPVNMEVMGYLVSHYHLWENENTWRFDPPWGKMADIRLTRLIPGRRITKEGLITAQCGYLPHFPGECMKDSGIRIKNYGYIKAEDRESKKQFYEKLNLKVGNTTPNFSHMTNVNGAYFHPWVENSTVSFYTPTNKGGNLLYNWLENIVYFADEVIVGNDNNALTDEDLQLLDRYRNVKVIPAVMGDNYAEGRNKVIEQSKSDYIFQLDIDEKVEQLLPIRRMIDVPNCDCWMFTIPNIQTDGGTIITETIRLFRNKDDVKYWGRLHETVDQHVKKNGWRINKSPVNIIHYGYTLQTPDEAYVKMQKYLEINLREMKENPMYGMVYYNMALHFLEDDLIEDAIKLLNIGVTLQPGFPLSNIELGKSYLRLAHRWMNLAMRGLQENHPIRLGFRGILDRLTEIQPKNYVIAKGHCLSFFNQRPLEAKWIREHIPKMEKTIEEMRLKQLEAQAKR